MREALNSAGPLKERALKRAAALKDRSFRNYDHVSLGNLYLSLGGENWNDFFLIFCVFEFILLGVHNVGGGGGPGASR